MSWKKQITWMCPVSGYSLIELMIALLITGILLKVALPSYNRQSLKVARVDAKISLLEAVAWQEKYYTRYFTYSLYANPLSVSPQDQILSASNHYLISISACEEGDISICFVAQAEPQGAQKEDECGIFYTDNTGLKSVSNEDAENCW